MSNETNTPAAAPEQDLSELLQIRRDKLIKADFDGFNEKQVAVAGRIMSKRGMGKAIFCHIQDDRGQIQLYIRKDAVTEQEFADFRKYDIGDIIGVTGFVFQTKTGEISVHVESVVLLSKSLRPLPEKFHGMTNTELKFKILSLENN